MVAKVRKRRSFKNKLRTSKAFKSTFSKKRKTSRISNMKCRIYKISLRSFKIKINKILELSNNFKITCSTTSQATKGCPSRTLWIPKPKARTWQSHLVIFLSKIPVDGSQRQGIKSTTTPKWASVAHITTNNLSNRNIHRTPSAANSILPRAERG